MSAATPSRQLLDQHKRQVVLALVANGSSRRVAARYLGCAPSTITRTAARDPVFAAELARAEQVAELKLLRLVQSAAKFPRYWRAAAWLLERKNPEDFAARPPRLITDEQVAEITAQIIDALYEDLPEENYRRAIERLTAALEEIRSLREPIMVELPEEVSEAQAAQSSQSTQITSATHYPEV